MTPIEVDSLLSSVAIYLNGIWQRKNYYFLVENEAISVLVQYGQRFLFPVMRIDVVDDVLQAVVTSTATVYLYEVSLCDPDSLSKLVSGIRKLLLKV